MSAYGKNPSTAEASLLRNPANVRRSLRISLSPIGSTARRDLGLATILDDDGQSARQIADQLGHARVLHDPRRLPGPADGDGSTEAP